MPPQGIQILANLPSSQSQIQSFVLSDGALTFLAALHRTFDSTRVKLLLNRKEAQDRLDKGGRLEFPPETRAIRDDPTWLGAPPAPGLEDRRVEITGPPDRKMVINALNSGAKTFMADFEDSCAPTWTNLINGQQNLYDAIRRTISFSVPGGKSYTLSQHPATLIVRPRGLHLLEQRLLIDSQPISGSLFDFGLYLFHNAQHLIQMGSGPYFYLPKMEHYLEARLWNDVFLFSQSYLRIRPYSIRATVLIETLPAAFQMEEIIFELRNHSSGLNCGRWDYIFSFIKKRRADKNAILPDRKDVTMEVGFMDAYVRLLIKTCHRRKVSAMGGMSAQIPIKSDPAANKTAMSKVHSDKLREVRAGHDGTWIAHPLINEIAMKVFDEYMLGPNQFHVLREDVEVEGIPAELVDSKKGLTGGVSEEGVRGNVEALLSYCSAWITGNGCVPINHLMEDAATAEIARVQLWQWAHYSVPLSSSSKHVTPTYIDSVIDSIVSKIPSFLGGSGGDDPKLLGKAIDISAKYLKDQVRKEWASDFLTSDLMGYLVDRDLGKGFEDGGKGRVRSSL